MTRRIAAAHIRPLLCDDLRVYAFANAYPWLKPNFAIQDVAVALLPASPSGVVPSEVWGDHRLIAAESVRDFAAGLMRSESVR